MPIYPNLLDMMSQSVGIYEGITLIPALFSNAQDHKNFYRNLKYAILMICVPVMIYSPMAVWAYKSQL